MGRQTRQARGNLRADRSRQRTGLGPYHPVPLEGGMGSFLRILRNRWEDILPPVDDNGSAKERFKLFKNPERIGVRVLEQGICRAFLERQRRRLNPNDLGRLKGRVADSIGHLGLSAYDLTLTFTGADRMGMEYIDGDREGGKFALLPDTQDPLYEKFIEANGLIVDAVMREYPGFRYPNGYEYRPHLTVAQIYEGAPAGRVRECGEALASIMRAGPVIAEIDPLVVLPR